MRDIIEINEELCNGCGLCVLDCAEGAIEIIAGKAKLVTDSFCDGLGACLSACPQDALRIIKRDAVPFNEEAAMEHVRKRDAKKGCLSKQVHIKNDFSKVNTESTSTTEKSISLGQWPLKIRLVPASAPFLQGAHVVVAADCSAFACPRFQEQYGAGKIILIGCPKFDDASAYAERLGDVLKHGNIASLTIVRMEVPCCSGLTSAVHKAYELSGISQNVVPLNIVTLNRLGQRVNNTNAIQLGPKLGL